MDALRATPQYKTYFYTNLMRHMYDIAYYKRTHRYVWRYNDIQPFIPDCEIFPMVDVKAVETYFQTCKPFRGAYGMAEDLVDARTQDATILEYTKTALQMERTAEAALKATEEYQAIDPPPNLSRMTADEL